LAHSCEERYSRQAALVRKAQFVWAYWP
jgi:hypothetical protein